MGAPDDVVIWVAVFVLQLLGWFRGVTMSGMQPGDVVLVLFLMAFIPTIFQVELSHVGACMTATLSSSHTSSLVLADARIGWPVAPSDFACRDFPPCRQPAVRFLTL